MLPVRKVVCLLGLLLLGLAFNLKLQQAAQPQIASVESNGAAKSSKRTVNDEKASVSSTQALQLATQPEAAAKNAEQKGKGSASKMGFDACLLLTASEIKAVQGAEVLDTKSSQRPDGNVTTYQCFYRLEPYNKSISLEVTRSTPGIKARNNVRDLWEERFDKKGKGEKEEEEEEKTDPDRVKGVGDDARWVGNGIIGVLYVLKRNSYLRLSIGGPEKASDKLEKSKTLALKAAKRMK